MMYCSFLSALKSTLTQTQFLQIMVIFIRSTNVYNCQFKHHKWIHSATILPADHFFFTRKHPPKSMYISWDSGFNAFRQFSLFARICLWLFLYACMCMSAYFTYLRISRWMYCLDEGWSPCAFPETVASALLGIGLCFASICLQLVIGPHVYVSVLHFYAHFKVGVLPGLRQMDYNSIQHCYISLQSFHYYWNHNKAFK